MIPKTAGKSLAQEELRAFTQCSEFYHRGGKVEELIEMTIVRSTIEHMLVTSLQEEIPNPHLEFASSLRRMIVRHKLNDILQDGEVTELLKECVYALNKLWSIMSPKDLVPISGPLTYRMIVNKTPVDLRVSGVLKKKDTQELIVPFFSPYTDMHSMMNDPVLHLQLDLLRQFGVKHHARNTVTAYVFALSATNHQLLFRLWGDKDTNPTYLAMIEQQILALEHGLHYPVLPCKYKCPFKNACFPRTNT